MLTECRDDERDRVTTLVPEVCPRGVPSRTRQQQCVTQREHGSTMTVRDTDLNMHADELFTDDVEMISTVEQQLSVQDPGAHAQSKQKRTRHHRKGSLSHVMVWVNALNKHVSDGVNKLPVQQMKRRTLANSRPSW